MRIVRSRRARRVVHALAIVALLAMAGGTARGQVLRIVDDPRSEPGAEFGRALAAVGADLAVGAPGALVLGEERAGRVELFGSDGSLLRTFDAQIPRTGATFGTTVTASGGLLYVGAPGDQLTDVTSVGAVYVFDVLTAALVRVVRAPDPDTTTFPVGGIPPPSGLPQSTAPRPVAQGFGRALAVAGDQIVVGAPDSTIDGLAGAGAVYVFGTDGALMLTLQELPARANASFGAWVVSIGGTLFVGAPGAPAGTVGGAGVVRMFDPETGALRGTLSAPISVTGAEFGAVVGEVGRALFIAAPGDSALGPIGMGAVYLFDAVTTAVRGSLTPPTPARALDFGRAAIAAGANLLVGADGAGRDGSGEVFLIDPNTSALLARFSPTIERAGGGFGFALAVVGSVVAIGEPAVGSTSTAGRVWLFGPASRTPTSGVPPTPTPRPGGAPTGPRTEPCPQAPTTTSISCRVSLLLGAVAAPSLERPLRHTRRELRRAESAHGRGRVRALRRAATGMQVFASRLGSHTSAGVAGLLAMSDGVSADLGALIATATR